MDCRGDVRPKQRSTTEISKKADFHIQFDETKVVCKVDRKFVSVAFSIGQLNKTDSGYDYRSKKLRRLLRALSPAVIRIGGSRANFLTFETKEDLDDKKTQKVTLDLPGNARLESRAYVPTPTPDDINRLETHQYKRFTLSLPSAKKKKPRIKKKPIEDKPDDEDDEKDDEKDKPGDVGGSGAMPPKPPAAEGPKGVGQPGKPPKEGDSPEEMTEKEKKKLKRAKKEKKLRGMKDFKMNSELFDDLYKLVNSTGNTMLFDINAFPRAEDSRAWNSTNACKLISYAAKKGYKIDWQLGNEPNSYKKFGKQREQTPGEVGNDYLVFKNLVKLKTPNAKIVGPDTTRAKKGGKVKAWLTDFLKTAGDTLDAVAWHQYYMDGKEAKADDFIDPVILDKFVTQNKLMKEILMENNFTKPVWITETGSAWGGGAKDLSDRFAGVFPYVDKLGVAGDNCVDVVARQAFLAGKYAMVNKTNYDPHPEFYAAALFKRLAAGGIIQVQQDKPDSKFRIYARCARASKHTLPGSVVVIVLNLNKQPKTFAFPPYELFKVKQYLFTADSLHSDVVKLNGKPLAMDGDNMPRMRPVLIEQPVKIPAVSVGFYVLDLISLGIC